MDVDVNENCYHKKKITSLMEKKEKRKEKNGIGTRNIYYICGCENHQLIPYFTQNTWCLCIRQKNIYIFSHYPPLSVTILSIKHRKSSYTISHIIIKLKLGTSN